MIKYAAVLLLLVGCNSGDDSAGNKGITSLWTSDDGTFSFDLSGQTVPFTGTMNFLISDGSTCSCSAALTGNETSGGYALVGCAYSGGGSGDPGCSSLDTSGNFEAQGANMTLCDSGGCDTFR